MQAHMEVEVEDEGTRRGVTGGSDEEEGAGVDKLGERLKRETAEVGTFMPIFKPSYAKCHTASVRMRIFCLKRQVLLVHSCAHTRTYTHAYINTNTCMHTHAHILIHTHVHTRSHKYYTNMRARAHAGTHVPITACTCT